MLSKHGIWLKSSAFDEAVMKCPICSKTLRPSKLGRTPKYCSSACRQKAYRLRKATSFRNALVVLTGELYEIRDHAARKRAAIKVLEEMGFEVVLRRRQGRRPTNPRASLKLISAAGNSEEEEQG